MHECVWLVDVYMCMRVCVRACECIRVLMRASTSNMKVRRPACTSCVEAVVVAVVACVCVCVCVCVRARARFYVVFVCMGVHVYGLETCMYVCMCVCALAHQI